MAENMKIPTLFVFTQSSRKNGFPKSFLKKFYHREFNKLSFLIKNKLLNSNSNYL